jgi:hypothetical protein
LVILIIEQKKPKGVSMRQKLLITISTALLILLAACGSSKAATPALDVSGTFTAVAQTYAAQQLIGTPLPSATEIPSLAATATLYPTFPPVSTAAVTSVSYSSSVTTSSCDNAAYTSDVTIPDGTEEYIGDSFTKTWKLYNSGTCTWDTGYQLVYVKGSQMSGASTSLTDTVSPGAYVEVSVDMVAPTTAGTYTGYWRMENVSDDLFGDTIYVQIIASESTSTPTLTPTATSISATSTPTSTSASIRTATSVPATSIPAVTSTIAPTNTAIPATATPLPTEAPTIVPIPSETSTSISS